MSNHAIIAAAKTSVVGFFKDPDGLLDAMTKVRTSKLFSIYDAFSPFPIHGMDEAQGLKRSFLPFVTFAAGLTGCSLGFLLQYWTSAVDWPINVGGKPFNSWQAFVPIMFELTILFAGLCTVAAMFIVNGLPNHSQKAFDPRLTRDRFAIAIETEPNEVARAIEFLNSIGAEEVKSIQTEGWF